ncbi:hypothetical protein D9M68_819160 [compost metagenome]
MRLRTISVEVTSEPEKSAASVIEPMGWLIPEVVPTEVSEPEALTEPIPRV